MRLRAGRLGTGVLLTVTMVTVAAVFTLVAVAAEEGEQQEGPMSPGGTVPVPRAPLLKENSRLVDIEGLILDMKDDLKISPVNRFVFQPKDGLGYFILLENTMLQKTLAETSHGERPIKVRGTITIFQGKNYLLLDWAAVRRE